MIVWWMSVASAGTIAASEGQETEPTEVAPPVEASDEVPDEIETPVAATLPRWADPALTDPTQLSTEAAPEVFRVQFDTTAGAFEVEVTRAWAPKGADRFHALVQAGMYDGMAFFRVIDGFMVQWGLSPYPEVNAVWREAEIGDDPVVASNTAGRITFATAGPNSRTTQLFINLVDNERLDQMGFAPFGTVVEGFDVVQSLYAGYGEGAPRGRGPNQRNITGEGDAYLMANYPDLDLIRRATVVPIRDRSDAATANP